MTIQGAMVSAEAGDRLEYSPTAIAGVVEHRTAGGTTMYVRVPWTRYIPASIVPAFLMLLTSALFYFLGVMPTPGLERGWGWVIVPGVFGTLTIMVACSAFGPLIFPTILEVTEEEVVVRWRTLTKSPQWRMDRREIRGVKAEKVRVHEGGAKQWHLCVLANAQGTIAVLRGSRRQVERLAQAMGRALGLSGEGSRAMRVPRPAGCRFSREAFGDGVRLILPPRFHKSALAGAGVVCFLSALLACLALRESNFGEKSPTIVVRANAVMLMVLLGSLGFFTIQQVFRRWRRYTYVVRHSQRSEVVQTGFLSPFSVCWKPIEVKAIRVEEVSKGMRVLRFEGADGKVVDVARGECLEDLEWAVEVLNSVENLRAAGACEEKLTVRAEERVEISKADSAGA